MLDVDNRRCNETCVLIQSYFNNRTAVTLSGRTVLYKKILTYTAVHIGIADSCLPQTQMLRLRCTLQNSIYCSDV